MSFAFMYVHLDIKSTTSSEPWLGSESVLEDEMVGWHHQLNGREFE